MKQTIILLHGLFGGLSNWQHVVEHFQRDADIHIPPLPIYDEHKENMLDYLVNALHNYIKSSGLKDVILIGNSLGGHVAILYAHRYPENVKSLVLTGSSGLYENYTIGSFPRRHDYSYIQRKVTDTFYDPAIATKELVDGVFEIVRDNRKCIRIIKTAKTTQRSYVTDILPEITTPVLLIWGIDDTITPLRVAEEFKGLLPDAELVYIPECGHAPMMERPDEFNMILKRFIKKSTTLTYSA
jgi:pimeloyl-ACP methyl ester carboxylesterase